MKRRQSSGPRAAFTIVELLVAMALIIFIMYIIAEAFAAGTSAFRNLKAIGDMNERLRSASTTLRRYLQADHFDGRRRLSDVDFWKNGPPQEGFFRIVQSGGSQFEGNDLDGLSSLQSNTQALHFLVKLRGNDRANYFRATVPNNSPTNVSPLLALPFADSRFQDTGNGGVVCSPAAEVAIFLRNSGVVAEDIDNNTGNASQPLFTMYFRQRLLVPDNAAVQQLGLATTPPLWPVPYDTAPNFVQNWKNYLEVSATQDPTNAAQLYFNNLQDVTMPGRRWGQYALTAGAISAGSLPDTSGPSPKSPANAVSGDGYLSVSSGNGAVYPRLADEDPNQAGNDVLLTDVLSWQMSVLLDNNAYILHTPANAPAVTPVPTAALNPNARAIDFVELSDDMITSYMPNVAPNTPAPLAPRFFDTWSNRKDDFYDYSGTNPPMFVYNQPNMPNHPLNGTKIRIRAIKMTLRIWDSKTKQSRMTSIIVDL